MKGWKPMAMTLNPVVRSKIMDIARRHTDVLFPEKMVSEIISAIVPDGEPKTRIERLKEEFDRIEKRQQSMKLFMMTPAFKELEYDERRFMDDESRAMLAYIGAMRLRLNLYGVFV